MHVYTIRKPSPLSTICTLLANPPPLMACVHLYWMAPKDTCPDSVVVVSELRSCKNRCENHVDTYMYVDRLT